MQTETLNDIKSAPLVSVIVPCHNAGKMLRAMFASVIAQTYPNIEIIWVNDNSTDDSLAIAMEIAKDCPRPVKIASTTPEARGVCAARVCGFALASGDFIQWLDADDELAPDKIALQVAAMEAHPEIDIASCEAIVRTHLQDGSLKEFRFEMEGELNTIRWFLANNCPPPHCYLLRRRASDRLAFEKAWFIGRYYAEDLEYWTIAAMLGLKFAHVPEAIVYYNRWSNQQATSRYNRTNTQQMFKAVQQRLVAIANRSAVRNRMTKEDRRLLNINWEMWKIYPNGIKQEAVGDDAVKLTSAVTGGSLLVTKREASIVEIIAYVEGGFLFDIAAYIQSQAKQTFPDMVEVLFLVDRFCKAGLIARAHEDRLQLQSAASA